MSIIRLALRPFHPQPEVPQGCPFCSCQGLQRWGRRQRPVKDRTWTQATVQRYRCKACYRTFTVRPQGLDRSPQTHPYQATLLALYLLGLSLRAVPKVLALLWVPSVSFLTLWRDIQRWGQHLRRPRLHTRIVGVDTTFVRLRGRRQGILLAVDLGGRTVLLEAVGTQEDYHRAFATLRHLGVEVVITDDDPAFHQPVESLGLRQQGCVWHAGRAVGRNLAKVSKEERERWREVLLLLRESLKALPPKPPPSLFQAQALPLPPPLRWAVVYLLNLWHRLTLYQRLPPLPKTNNHTEQAIGRSKMRARTVRGFKSLTGILNFFALTQLLLETP